VKSVLKKIKNETGDFRQLSEQVIFHINDTHPTLIIPEIMRILLDEEGYEWVDAWEVTRKLTAYTNHTILAEALERWPVSIFQPILPRIYQLIEEIDRRFRLELLATSTFKSKEMIEKLAIIEHQEIRMAHCCVVASSSVNGVAKLHTEILKKIEMADFYQLFPEKFRNVTNGISHRRWLIQANPELTGLLKQTIGEDFYRQPEKLAKLLAFQDDERVQATFLRSNAKKKWRSRSGSFKNKAFAWTQLRSLTSK
jgi:starch phosphorylase